MQWQNGSRLFAVVLLAVFSLLLPSFVNGEEEKAYILTQEQMMQLDAVFNGLQMENEGLQSDLSEAKTLLSEAKAELKEVKSLLTKAATSFEESVKAQAATLSMARTDAVIWKVVAGVFATATLYLAIR